MKQVREGEILCGILYMWNLKRNDTNELTHKTEGDSQTYQKTNFYDCQGEGMVMHTLLYLKWITNKDLLFSIWNSAQCYVAVWMEGEFGGECI